MSREALLNSVAERRKGERVNRVVAIRHRLIKRSGLKAASAWSLSTTKNMSHSGLLFLSSIPYRKGDILELQVVMSGIIEIYSGQAQVTRVIEIGNTSFDVAVKNLLPKAPPRKAKSHLKA
jgi:hypothetical protein